jgi:hypothetical protein
MNKLETLGALVANAIIEEHRNEKVALLVAEAKESMTDEQHEAQFDLWNRIGRPNFELLLSANHLPKEQP